MADEESTSEEETFEVDGKQVSRDELINGYKFASANHERAEAIKRERETVEAERKRLAEERQAWLNERQSANKTNEQIVETLRGFAPKQEAEPDTPYPVVDRIKQIDLLGDSEANQKIASEIQAALDDREARVSRREEERRKKEIADLTAGFERRLSEETGKVKTQLVMESAREKAQRENEEVFKRTLSEKYGDLQFDAETLADVKDHFFAQVKPGTFGNFDEAGQWRYKPEAVEAGLWASPKGRQLLLAREKAGSRAEGMTARVRGEAATNSTPSRSTRQTGGGDDVLVEKIERYNRGLRAGIYTREQVLGAFTDKEMARYNELRQSARADF